MGFSCGFDFPIFAVGWSKIFLKKYLHGFTVFGWTPLEDLAEDIAGVGFKTGPITPHQIDVVRLSETKEAHKSQTPIIAVVRVVSSR